MSIEKLLKQKAAIDTKIREAELVAKNKNRVETLVVKTLAKYPTLFLSNPTALQKSLDDALKGIASSLKT